MKNLSQSVGNPVGDESNTDSRTVPSNTSSSDVSIVPGVCNPVGSPLNTDQGTHQTPLPMRPIPS